MTYETCETIQVKGPANEGNPTGMIVINASDFVEGQHELFVKEGEKAVDAGKKSAAAKKPSAEVPKAPPAPQAETPAEVVAVTTPLAPPAPPPAPPAVAAPWKQS